ncbi:MAG: hypothetical protein PVI35_03500 [Acidimicrobiia bacterium]|jgi:hypothetical protein
MMRRALLSAAQLLLLAVLVMPGGPVMDALPASPVPAAHAADEVQPAVEAPPVSVEETEQPWTARYLAPTVVAIGVLSVAGAAVFYLVRVRGRYTIAK